MCLRISALVRCRPPPSTELAVILAVSGPNRHAVEIPFWCPSPLRHDPRDFCPATRLPDFVACVAVLRTRHFESIAAGRSFRNANRLTVVGRPISLGAPSVVVLARGAHGPSPP